MIGGNPPVRPPQRPTPRAPSLPPRRAPRPTPVARTAAAVAVHAVDPWRISGRHRSPSRRHQCIRATPISSRMAIIIHLFCYGEIPGPCVQKAQAKVCEKDSKVKNKEAFNTVVVLIACVIQKEQNNESLTGKTRTAGRTIAVGTCWGLARKGVLVF
uniref:Uncharacterized protein n=1 Tax=Oryza glumipatula TaxID=40148 RepID=A0A0D9ZA89_9ORYZ